MFLSLVESHSQRPKKIFVAATGQRVNSDRVDPSCVLSGFIQLAEEAPLIDFSNR